MIIQMDPIKIKAKLINELRNNIDEIDSEIIQLLGSRLEKARQIIKMKNDIGEPAHSPDRERDILNTLAKKSSGLIHKPFIESIYNIIFTESKNLTKSKENPFSLTFYIADDKALSKFKNIPNYISNGFKFVLAFDDPSLNVEGITATHENAKSMFFSERFSDLKLLKSTPSLIVPNYFHNFCEETQKLYAEYANKNNSTLVLKYGNGFYLKEFINVLDTYLSILDSAPAILVDRQAIPVTESSNEINLDTILSSKPYSTATLFKDVCYLGREIEIVNIARASYASGTNSVIVDINTLTYSSIQTLIEFCQVLSKL